MTVVTIVDDDGELCFEDRTFSENFVPTVITVRFDHMDYLINEDAGIAQPLLVLSGPSSFVETVQIITISSTADGRFICLRTHIVELH